MTNHKLSCLLFFVLGVSLYLPTFAQLPGPVLFGSMGTGPFVNTTGWQLLDDGTHLPPQAVDTNGDTDLFPNELVLTTNTPNYAGGVFYNSQLDVTNNCDFWIADFDFRIFEGTTPGDGMAFVVTTAVPTGASSGGNLGLPPGGFTGFSVCFDTYDNCGIANPAVEIRYNSTDECAVGPEATLPTLHQNIYHNCRVVYNSGTIDVYIDGSVTPTITGSYNISTPVFLGFVAATGGATDAHSVKNVSFYVAPNGGAADAGADQSLCSSGNITLGVANQPALPYVYNWTPTTGLSSSTISNPALSLNNAGTLSDTTIYIVNTSIGTCLKKDTTSLIVIPYPSTPNISASASQICQGDSVTLVVTQQPGNTVLNWYDAAVGGNLLSSGYIYQTSAINVTTTFYAEAINDNLCAAARQGVTITVQTAPTSPTVNAPAICQGSDGIFHATAPSGMSFMWYTVSTGGSPIYTGANLNIGVVPSDTTLYVSATNAIGCTSLTRTQVILTVLPAPAAAQAQGDTVCVGKAGTLTIINPLPGMTYKWYKNTTITTPLGTGTSFTTPNIILNTYYFVEPNNLGCAGPRSAVFVKVTQLPAAPVAIADTICPNNQALLSVMTQNGVNYEWYSSAISVSPLATGPTLLTTTLTSTTNFYVQSIVGQCASANRTVVKGLVDVIPPAPIGADKAVCLNGQVDLYVTPNPNYTAEWHDIGGNIVYTGDVYHISNVLEAQEFVLYGVSRLAGCKSFWTDTVRVTISPPPAADFEIVDNYLDTPFIIKDTVEVGEPAKFISTSANAYTYTWNFGNGWYANSTVTGSNKPQFPYPKEGEFPVTLVIRNSDGCVDSITKMVYVENIREIFVATAFSPNNDKINDEIGFTSSRNLWNFSIKIFDRWGKEVFSTTNLSDTWDGRYGKYGDGAPEGVYTWMAEFEIADRTKRTKMGSITLIR
jgi:gliding motility-associated-like protein